MPRAAGHTEPSFGQEASNLDTDAAAGRQHSKRSTAVSASRTCPNFSEPLQNGDVNHVHLTGLPWRVKKKKKAASKILHTAPDTQEMLCTC